MLEIKDLKTNFNTYDGVVKALDGVNLKIKDGEIFGLVGETGSGKSVTCYSALRLLPKTGEIVGGSIVLNGEDITNASEKRLREIRGGEIGIIFQDPLSALNPVMTSICSLFSILRLLHYLLVFLFRKLWYCTPYTRLLTYVLLRYPFDKTLVLYLIC